MATRTKRVSTVTARLTFTDCLSAILNKLPVYGPHEIRRSIFYWVVGRYYSGYGDFGFDVDRRFWTKKAAQAELVRLALEGEKVKL